MEAVRVEGGVDLMSLQNLERKVEEATPAEEEKGIL